MSRLIKKETNCEEVCSFHCELFQHYLGGIIVGNIQGEVIDFNNSFQKFSSDGVAIAKGQILTNVFRQMKFDSELISEVELLISKSKAHHVCEKRLFPKKYYKQNIQGTTRSYSFYYQVCEYAKEKCLIFFLYDKTDEVNWFLRERLYCSILENSAMIIVQTDVNGIVQYVNTAFEKISGYKKEYIVGKTTRILNSGYHSKSFYQDLWQTIKSGKRWEGSMLNKNSNGEKYWERSIIVPYFDENNDLVGFVKNAEDITQSLELKRNFSEERNLFLYDPVLVFKWEPDENLTVRYVSPNVDNVLGYTSAELINEKVNFKDLIHPSEILEISDEIHLNLNNKEVYNFSQQYQLQTQLGEYRFFNVYNTLERDSSGQVTSINGYLIDNTEYFNTQKELKKSELRYRDVFETAGVGIIYTNKEGVILDTNKKFGELVGHPPQFLHGKSVMELINNNIPREIIKDLLPILFHMLKGNRIAPIEINFNNQAYEMQSDYNPQLESNIGILRDITDKKQVQIQLQKSEAQYRHLVEHINDGIIITDKNEQIIFFNPAADKILGISNPDIETIKDVVTPDSVLLIEEEEKKRLQGKVGTYFIEISTTDNKKKTIEVSASPMYTSGEVYNGSFGVIRDITDKVSAEFEIKLAYSKIKIANEQLRERAKELEIAKVKAEESDRLKSAFLANISHEIRTPMNGIIGFAQLSMTRDLSEEKRSSYLKIVTDSTMQLEAVVMDIIDLSKIESGESKFNKRPVNVKDVIYEVYDICLPKANEKPLKINLEIDGNISDINTDLVRFRQVVKILLSNAIKFTLQGTITVKAEARSTEIWISVIDTGIGIASDQHEIIFEPFRQVELAMKRRFGGTGLGLTIARKIAQMMGGNVTLESELGKGSTFYFTHPIS